MGLMGLPSRGCGGNGLIPKYIGSAYDNVKTVADSLDSVKVVADNIDDVVTVGDNIEAIKMAVDAPRNMGTYRNGLLLETLNSYCTWNGENWFPKAAPYRINAALYPTPDLDDNLENSAQYMSGDDLRLYQDQMMGYISKGDYAAGIELNGANEYVWYDGKRWFAVNPPYTTTVVTPDADANLSPYQYNDIFWRENGFQPSGEIDVGYALKAGFDLVQYKGVGYPLSKSINGAITSIETFGNGAIKITTSTDTVYGLIYRYYHNDKFELKAFGSYDLSGGLADIDSSLMFQACFQSAYEANKPVIGEGVFYLDNDCTCWTDLDLSSATIRVPPDFHQSTAGGMDGGVIFIGDKDTQVIENFDLSGLKKGDNYHANLVSLGVCTVKYESYTENAYKRTNGSSVSYLKKQDFLYCSSGYFQATPTLYTINDPVKLIVRPIRNRLEVKAPQWIITETPDEYSVPSLFNIQRNNVHVYGGEIDTFSMPSGAKNPVNAFVRFLACGFGSVNDQHTTGLNKDFSYAVHCVGTYNITIDNCTDQKIWGLVDGQTMRSTVIKQSVGARIGSHFDAVDFTVENYTNTRDGILVSGHGLLKINGYYHSQLTSGAQTMIATRPDYGWCWDGTMDIRNIEATVSGSVGEGACMLKLRASLDGQYAYEGDVKLPSQITIDGFEIVDNSTTPHTVRYDIIQYDIDFEQPTLMPKKVEMSGIVETGFANMRLGYSSSHPVITNSNCISGTTTYNLKGLYNVTGDYDVFQKVDGTVTSQNPVIRNYDKHTGLNISCSWSAGFELNVYNSTIAGIDGESSSGSNEGSCTLRGNVITGQFCRWTTNGNGDMKLMDNTFTNKSEIKLGNAISVCSSNTIPVGATISGSSLTPADLWSYKNSSKYQ